MILDSDQHIFHAKWMSDIFSVGMFQYCLEKYLVTLILLSLDLSFFENTVDPDQLASDEAIWSGSIQFSKLVENVC